jgi:hypothetical protein
VIVFPVVVVLGEVVLPDTPVPPPKIADTRLSSPKIAGVLTLSAETIASTVALTGAAVVGLVAPARALLL